MTTRLLATTDESTRAVSIFVIHFKMIEDISAGRRIRRPPTATVAVAARP